MKAMKIPVAILVALLLASLADAFLLTKQCAYWTDHLDEMERNAIQADWTRAQDSADALKENWGKWQTYLHILIDHDEIDRAEELIALCQLHIEEKDTAALRVTVSQLRNHFSLLAETEQLNIKNVL